MSRPLEVLTMITADIVRSAIPEDRDLSARQLAVFGTVYTSPEPLTVRGMAKHLNINKPAVTRALDRLEEMELIKRLPDPADRRSILIGRCPSGTTYAKALDRVISRAVQFVGAEAAA